MSDYIITYTKKRFTPLEPRTEEIDIVDIAHALSFMTRANGHFPEFYSVAQHCMHCCEEALARGYSKREALACLLHDASEAYLADITRPVKHNLSHYLEIEKVLQDTIYQKYFEGGLSEDELIKVALMDDTLLYSEFKFYMEVEILAKPTVLKSNPVFETLAFKEVEKKYLKLFTILTTEQTEEVVSNSTGNYLTVGIDGCKGKWICVSIFNDGFQIKKFAKIEDVCKEYKHADSILLDMPIGLPVNKEEEVRRPDSSLRKVLRGKASSVFSVPCRQAVYAGDKVEMRQKNIVALGKSLSSQSIAIIPKIREVDEFLNTHMEWKNRLRESHPEVCFALLNHGQPIMERKVEQEGMRKRIEVLEDYYPKVREVVKEFLAMGYGQTSINDLLDALCLAIVGQIECRRGVQTIPENPTADTKGLDMQVVVPWLD